MPAKTIESHIACGECGSSDAKTVYEDDDGKRFWKCYSCEGTGQIGEGSAGNAAVPAKPVPGKYAAIPERDITADTARFYGITDNGKEWCFPYAGGHKARLKAEKVFYSDGKPKGLFGQDRFPAGGKYVTLTEGEFDACAAYQMLGSRYPAVSIRRGAATAVQDVREAYEWLDTFDKVVICFDSELEEPSRGGGAEAKVTH
jgi:twinkle protein